MGRRRLQPEWDVALHGGRTLIVAQSDAGKLLRIDVDPRGAEPRQITGVAPDEPVYGDGLLSDQGRLVAVTLLPDPTLTFIRLDARGTSGTVEERRTHPTFRGLSTVDRAGNFYLVVNADFDSRHRGVRSHVLGRQEQGVPSTTSSTCPAITNLLLCTSRQRDSSEPSRPSTISKSFSCKAIPTAWTDRERTAHERRAAARDRVTVQYRAA